MRMTIANIQALFGACVFFLVLAVAGIFGYAHLNLRIGSPSYQRIVAGKDLVADVLPPPEYIIEAYLEANMIERFGVDAKRKAKLSQLRHDFDDRRVFWAKADLPASLKTSLTETAARPATRFFEELDRNFLPAVEKADKAAVTKSFDVLTQAYNDQRAAVDELVGQANKFLDDAEKGADERSGTLTMIAGGSLLLVLVGLIAATVMMKRRVADSVKRIADCMTKLARGGEVGPLAEAERDDEIAEMARAIAVFEAAGREKRLLEAREAESREQGARDRAARDAEREQSARQTAMVIGTLAESLGRLSEGDLLHEIQSRFEGESDKLRADFNQTIMKLREVVHEVVRHSQAIRVGSQEISIAADDLARRTDSQASSLEQTAASLSQITTTVKQAAENSSHARDLVARAKQDADLGGDIATQAIEAMNGIEKASQQISHIIGVIDEIAFQTNLLALNAGVEAARAGDSGRGFAVVAQEVRALAQRSAEAAKEIKDLITGSRVQVERGVGLVGETGAALGRIVEEVQQISDIVTTMSVSAKEQATGLSEINLAMSQMDTVTQQNAAMVQQSTAASRKLAQRADELASVVGRFSVGETAPMRPAAAPRPMVPATRPQRSAAPLPPPAPARAKRAANGPAVASAGSGSGGQDWDEF